MRKSKVAAGGGAAFRGAMIRMLDHTADVGFELGAPSLEALFDEARRALLMVVFEHPPEEGEGVDAVSLAAPDRETDRKSTRLNSSHANISYAVFCLKK